MFLNDAKSTLNNKHTNICITYFYSVTALAVRSFKLNNITNNTINVFGIYFDMYEFTGEVRKLVREFVFVKNWIIIIIEISYYVLLDVGT